MTEDIVERAVFAREERYIVIKRKYLSGLQETALRAHMDRLQIGIVESAVVESDWPEYEPVWQMIEDRVSGRPSEITRLRAQVEAMAGALEIANDAIREMFRYFDGGETRGSYDGRPERNQLRAAGDIARRALLAHRSTGAAHE